VLAEDVASYFAFNGISPYMSLVKQVKKDLQVPLPADFEKKDLLSKLYFQRSNIPAVTHIDYTARLQTLHHETNPRFWKLLQVFKKNTGCSLMINTSFNVRGEPIVNTPEEAYVCFMRTDMDFLVVGNYLFDKKRQPEDMPGTLNLELTVGLD
jgi:carbamoyltransferase